MLNQEFEEDLLADSPSRYPRGHGRRVFFSKTKHRFYHGEGYIVIGPIFLKIKCLSIERRQRIWENSLQAVVQDGNNFRYNPAAYPQDE
jgi:hypothetical protein